MVLAGTEIVIIADADTIPDNISQIHMAVSLVVNNFADVVWPFTEYYHIDKDWATKDDFKSAPVQQFYSDSPGGIFVTCKESLRCLGGFDERFTPGAMGYDDTSFKMAADTLAATARVPGKVYSFNHATDEHGFPDRVLGPENPNFSRFQLYEMCYGKPKLMKELIK